MYNSNILDPIHGLIKVSEIEKWIFGQKPFNRLRRIKQNTFLYLVFPSANHTRFEHSIGVMHLANQIYQNANENYSTGRFKKSKYLLEEIQGFDFYSTSDNLSGMEPVLIQELRIAALLHDVGHGPMSHLFDHYTITGNKFLEIIKGSDDLRAYEQNFRNLLENPENRINHEVVSCFFVIRIINQLKKIDKKYVTKFNENQKDVIDKLDVKRIIEMIEPGFNTESQLIFGSKNYRDFFSSIISSFPLDADRMDYMSRDSYFAGVNYGSYDRSRIMMSFIPIIEGDNISLAIKESGVDSVIRFIQSRTHLYNQVYFHKTNRAANCMLDFACNRLTEGEPINTAIDEEQFEEFYWKNSDEIFLWDTLKNKISTNPESEVLDELLERNLVKRIYQHKITLVGKSRDEIEKINKELKKLVAEFKIESASFEQLVLIDNFPNQVFKGVEKSKIKIVKKQDEKYELKSDWRIFNKELEILEHEVVMFRIYMRGKFADRNLFNQNKKKILENLSQLIIRLKNIENVS